MNIQNLLNIIKEGQEKSLIQLDLVEKELNGTITPEEKDRLKMLNGNLLALARQAQAYGYGTAVAVPEIHEIAEEESFEEYITEEPRTNIEKEEVRTESTERTEEQVNDELQNLMRRIMGLGREDR